MAELFPGFIHHVTLLDGNCFFDCMKKTALFPGDDVQQIRLKVVDFLAGHSDTLLSEIFGEGGATGKHSFCYWPLAFLEVDMSLLNLAVLSASDILLKEDLKKLNDDDDRIFKAYLEKMRCDGVYADSLCFYVVVMVPF